MCAPHNGPLLGSSTRAQLSKRVTRFAPVPTVTSMHAATFAAVLFFAGLLSEPTVGWLSDLADGDSSDAAAPAFADPAIRVPNTTETTRGRVSIAPPTMGTLPIPTTAPRNAPSGNAEGRVIPAVCHFGPAVYVNGAHPDTGLADSYGSASIIGETWGDVDGDGIDEVVIEVLCGGGGSVTYGYDFLFAADDQFVTEILAYDTLFSLYPAASNATIDITGISSSGLLRVDVYLWFEDDPNCCPSVEGALFGRWNEARQTFDFSAELTSSQNGVALSQEPSRLTQAEEQALAIDGFVMSSDASLAVCNGSVADTDRRVTNVKEFLNVRVEAGVGSDLVMRLGPDYVLEAVYLDQIRYVDGRPWIMVMLPVEQELGRGCGWVHSQYLSSASHGSLEDELG